MTDSRAPSATPRVLALLLVLAVVAAACTGGGDEPEDGGETTSEQSDGQEQDTQAGGGAGGDAVMFAPGVDLDVEPAILDATGTWIAEESGLTDMLREELFLEQVSQTADVTHLTFVQQHDEVSVRGAQFIVHVRENGEVIGASQSLTETLPGDGVTEELTADEAFEIAEKAVPGTVVGDPTTTATWLEVGTELRLGWEVQVTTEDPPAGYAVVVDATDGQVLSVDRLSTDHSYRTPPDNGTEARDGAGHAEVAGRDEVAQAGGCNAPAPPSACIFVVDPIYASGNPGISPAQANSTLVGVPLANLTNPAGGDLIGRYAQITPPSLAAYSDPDGVHGQGGRGGQDITFESGMTYYWIDYSQQIVQELGYRYHADDPVDFEPIARDFPDNAQYLFLEDLIRMGSGGDGVNEAEDAQGIIHEYGHALLQAAVPNIRTEEGIAFHEGFADLASVFTTLEFRNGDVECLFHWAEQGVCIRRVDRELVYPDDLRFEVHLDGEIFTGAVWEIFRQVLDRETGLTPNQCQDRQTNPCDAVRDQVYGTLLGSLPFLTPTLDLNDAATAFAVSDQTFYASTNADIIQQVFAARGLQASGTPMTQIDGLDDFEAADSVVGVKIQHTYRGDIELVLDVVDGQNTQLCSATLVSPDPNDSEDNITGRFGLDGTTCAEFLPPGPDSVWLLTARDFAVEDEGTLFQFSISHAGRRFLASSLPQIIPDDDPVGVTAQIGATTPTPMGVDGPVASAPPVAEPTAEPAAPQDATEEPVAADPPAGQAPPAAGQVTAQVDIQHTYVGDLSVSILVVDLLSETTDILCRVDLWEPDSQNSDDDLSLTASADVCAGFYPPSATQPWVLRVIDVAAQDEGQVTGFSITGPEGTVEALVLPEDIPDDDVDGVLLPIIG
ncbi:PepSY domain-containing protein [Euzebya tangerina]|uniref:PepSY domain-containing protein n=1 Tax=Euzebya tangerina TaxID=591198 RepID=UPI000E31925E|nr:PepSY domain-containing protein [Euzebya tangerina]